MGGGYGGYEVDVYDEYEDEGEEQYEEDEEGEEEVEEEEERKPTAEELEYLELRKRLKERYRKNLKKESSSALTGSQEKKNKLPYDNYGSFFGPSKPVISQRVIQESKSLLETQHLANKVSHSHRGNEKTTGSKAGVPRQLPKVNPLQTKVQKIKVSRDYSFLSDDAELPATKKHPPAQSVSRQNSEARPAPLPIKNKQPLSNNGRNVQGAREERKPISSNGQMHPKAGPHKSTPASKPNLNSMDNRKQHSSSNGIGPGRPAGPKSLPSKIPVAPTMKKASASGAKNVPPSTKVPPSSKMPPPVQKKHLEQKKGLEEPNRGKMGPKQTVASSKPQLNRPVKQQIPSRPMVQDDRPKKKPLRHYSDYEDGDEDAEAFNMLRSMLGPRKFANYDDDDDSDMEAGFDDIMREEKRSARIARKEDEEQLRLIEEEERQERLRKLAKKRKLSQRN